MESVDIDIANMRINSGKGLRGSTHSWSMELHHFDKLACTPHEKTVPRRRLWTRPDRIGRVFYLIQ